MKLTLTFLLVLCVVLVSCRSTDSSYSSGNGSSSSNSSSSSDSGILTAEKAQDAIDRFVKANGGGRIRIRRGVREIPAQNSAIAEFDVEEFKGEDNTRDIRNYAGESGQATFLRFTDGKWTMTRVDIRYANGFATATWQTTVEVR